MIKIKDLLFQERKLMKIVTYDRRLQSLLFQDVLHSLKESV